MNNQEEITILTYLWSNPKERTLRNYKPVDVNALAYQFRYNTTIPHKFVCVTNFYPDEFDPEITVYPLPQVCKDLIKTRTRSRGFFPLSAYAKLWSFSQEAKQFGDRILAVDVDMCVIKNIDHLINPYQDYDFVGYRGTGTKKDTYFTGMSLQTTGMLSSVWDSFDKNESPNLTHEAGFRGSDQAWLNYCFLETDWLNHIKHTGWPIGDGIMPMKDINSTDDVPEHACILLPAGKNKPNNHFGAWMRQAYWPKHLKDRNKFHCKGVMK